MSKHEELLVEYHERLHGYLYHLVGDHSAADDLWQEISIAVLQNPSMIDRDGDVFAYLRGVARHVAASHRRKMARAHEALRRWTEWAWEHDPDDQRSIDEQQDQIEHLRTCLKQLPENLSRIVNFRYEKSLDLQAIAEQMQTTVVSIKSALFRIRRQLATCIRQRMAKEMA